jgi:hypothetical protein
MNNIIYYCSNCGFEVSEHQEVCPACGASLENPKSSEDDAFAALVKTYDNYLNACVARDLLDSEGITSMISESDAKSAYRTDYFNRPVRLFVMEKDFKKAYEILDSYEKASPLNDTGN